VADFTESYRGYIIHVQILTTSDGMADIWCRICYPCDSRLSLLAGEMMKLSGGPFESSIAHEVGMYYGMQVIDGYLGNGEA